MSHKEEELALKHLVLLPGLDGTGQLFGDILKILPPALNTELLRLVSGAVPQTEPFVLLTESFSTPLALKYAATNPSNLAAVVISAGFARNPIGGWSQLVKTVAKPWISP